MMQQTLPSRRRAEKKNYFKAETNIRDFIKFYNKKYGTPKKGGCDPKIYRAVVNEFNAYMADQLIKGDRFHLPFGMGYIEVIKKKQKFKIKDGSLDKKLMLVDWPKTWEYWKINDQARINKKLLYYTNEHTDGFRYKVRWERSVADVKLRTYAFKPSRLLSRKIADYVMDPESLKNYSEKC